MHNRVIVEPESEVNESSPPTPKNKQASDSESNCMYCGKQYPFTFHCHPKRTEAALLKKSKKLLIHLIDKELDKVQGEKTINIKQTNGSANKPLSVSNTVQLKIECFDKINEELSVLKDLEGIDY